MMLNADNARIAAQRASMAGRSGPANAGFGDLFAQDPLSLSSLVLNNNTISLSGSGQPQPVYAATMQERLAGVMWGYPTTDVKPENTIVVSDSGSSLTNLGMGLGAVVTLGAAPGIMATGEALVGRFAATTFGRATIASGSMLDLVTLANWDPADGPLLGFGGAGRVANTPSARMFSSSELMGVEPASNDLLAAVGRRRDVVIAQPGSQELRMLDYFGAEASVGTHVTPLGLEIDNGSILLRQNPSKAAVLEEFLHGTQARLGITERLGRSGMGSAETHVKDFMIRHQSMLGLSNEDVEILRILRDKGL
jgi:hypothetical protein